MDVLRCENFTKFIVELDLQKLCSQFIRTFKQKMQMNHIFKIGGDISVLIHQYQNMSFEFIPFILIRKRNHNDGINNKNTHVLVDMHPSTKN